MSDVLYVKTEQHYNITIHYRGRRFTRNVVDARPSDCHSYSLINATSIIMFCPCRLLLHCGPGLNAQLRQCINHNVDQRNIQLSNASLDVTVLIARVDVVTCQQITHYVDCFSVQVLVPT